MSLLYIHALPSPFTNFIGHLYVKPILVISGHRLKASIAVIMQLIHKDDMLI